MEFTEVMHSQAVKGKVVAPGGGAAGGFGEVLVGDALDVAEGLEKGILDLIYMDPPFFTKREHVGNAQKAGRAAAGGAEGGSLEFSDVWRAGMTEYLAWLRARVVAMRRLLKAEGTFLLHLDWHAVHYAKVMCDEIFGGAEGDGVGSGVGGGGFQNELIWYYQTGGASKGRFSRKHDTILFYSMGRQFYFDGKAVAIPRGKGAMKRARCATGARIKVTDTHKNPDDVLIVPALNPMARERNGYPTQKPVALLEVLIKALCPPEGSVGDFCCGSGTTLVAAQKLGRKWIGGDANAAAVKVARGRLGM